MSSLVEVENLKHSYRDREALRGVSFSVERGEIFGFLGPNGSGKTTLFRILATSFLPTAGKVRILDLDIAGDVNAVRKKIGVVFQSPSLDGKLRVRENLTHQGHLYGLYGEDLKKRTDAMLQRLGLTDRQDEAVEKLSGGLKRRVELAKGLLHGPLLMILDEPSTGLDPGARLDLWKYLKTLKAQHQITVLVTTHLMEEAEHCDRLAVLHEGRIACLGTPEQLKAGVGKDILLIKGKETAVLAEKIKQKFNLDFQIENGIIHIQHDQGAQFVARIAEAFPGEIESVTFRKPSLEDVFIQHTGHQFWFEEEHQKK